MTALMIASTSLHLDVVTALLAANAIVDSKAEVGAACSNHHVGSSGHITSITIDNCLVYIFGVQGLLAEVRSDGQI